MDQTTQRDRACASESAIVPTLQFVQAELDKIRQECNELRTLNEQLNVRMAALEGSIRSRNPTPTLTPAISTRAPPSHEDRTFGDVRINCYVLGQHGKAISFPVSAILLNYRTISHIGPDSLSFTKFQIVITGELMSAGCFPGPVTAFHPSIDGPQPIQNQVTL
ncbi:Nn.00g062000.m01.CDS01 [Neocucurbitaria sp. VM-36]